MLAYLKTLAREGTRIEINNGAIDGIADMFSIIGLANILPEGYEVYSGLKSVTLRGIISELKQLQGDWEKWEIMASSAIENIVDPEIIKDRLTNPEFRLPGEIEFSRLKEGNFKGRIFKWIEGFSGFSGNTPGVKDNGKTEKAIEDKLKNLISRYGLNNILVVSGATDFGAVHNVYNVAKRLGLSTMGLVARAGLETGKIRKCDYYYVEEEIDNGNWGSEKGRYVNLINGLTVVNSGPQGTWEMKTVAEMSKPVTVMIGVRAVGAGINGQGEMSYLVHSGQQSIVNGIIMETEAKLTEAGHPPDEIKALMKQLKEARAALNFTIKGKVNINVIDINETKKEYLGTLEKLKKGLPGYGLKILEAGPGKLEIEITVLKDYSGDAFNVKGVIPSADDVYNKFIKRLAYDVGYISEDGSDTSEYGMAKATIKNSLREFGEYLKKIYNNRDLDDD